MFKIKFLRNIILTSLAIVIILPLYNIIIAYPSFIKALTLEAEDEAMRTARHLMSMLNLKEMELDKKSLSINSKTIETFKNDFMLDKIKIFSPSGENIYSTVPEDMGIIIKKPYFHEIVAKGNSYSMIISKNNKSLDGHIITADLVETYIPIMNGDKFLGAFEIYYDITKAKERFNKLRSEATIIVIVLGLGLFVLVFITSSRAAKVINKNSRTLEALEVSEKKYRELVDNSLVGIYKTTLKGDLLYANQALANIFEFGSPEEMVSENVLVIYRNPEDRKYIIDNLKKTGRIESYEVEAITSTGEGRNVLISGSLESDIISGMLMDITQRKKAKKALEKSEHKYKNLFEHAIDSIFIIDPDSGCFLDCNEVAADRLGYTKEELLNLTVGDMNTPDESSGIKDRFKRQIDGESIIFETLHRRKDGTYMPVEVSTRPIEFEGKKILQAFARDMTERKRAEEQLLYSRQSWEDTFNSITDMITIHDKDFNITQANATAKRILKLPAPGTAGTVKCYEFYHGTACPLEGCPTCESLNTKEAVVFEVFEPHLNMLLEIRGMPQFDQSNNFIGLIHIGRDVTERSRSEDLIRVQLKRLSVLHEIEKAVNSSLDLHSTLDLLTGQIDNHLGIDAITILLLDQNTQTLEHVISKGFRSNALKYTHMKLDECNAGRAALEKHIIVIPDFKRDPGNFERSNVAANEDFISYFALPLIVKGEVKGVMELFHRVPLDVEPEWLEFIETIADQAAVAIDNASLFNDLQRSNIELTLAYDSTIVGWSLAMDLRDKETEGHSRRVADLTLKIASELGIKDLDLVHIRRGALLHDIGKMGVPDNILLKPGKLTDEEWKIMKRHPEYAFDMLNEIDYLKPALDIPVCHHEKWDGTGYPKGLKGKEIPLAARIFAIVDVWDALSSDRPYRHAWPKVKVLEHIRSESGIHFDPEVVKIFFKFIGNYRSVIDERNSEEAVDTIFTNRNN